MSPQIILGIVAVYFVVLMLVAYLTGKDNDQKSFFIGSKKSPWLLVAFGMIGASLSGVTFISIPGVIGNLDEGNPNMQFSYMQMVLGYLLGYLVIAAVLMPLYYRLQLTSIYTYLEQRFGQFSYKTGAACFLISRTIGAAFRLFLVALVLQQFVFDDLGIPYALTVLVILALIWIYTYQGGIKTIVWTDTIQTAAMIIAVVIALFNISDVLNISLIELPSVVKNSNYGQWFFWDSHLASFFPKQFFAGAAIALVMTGLDQDMMQKNNSCSNIKSAQKNMFVFCIILVFVNMLFLGLGAGLYLVADTLQMEIPARTDLLFPTLALNYFGPVAGVAFVIGLIAAAFSSADSALTALTTSVCIDFLGMKSDETTSKQRYIVHFGVTTVLFITLLIFNSVLTSDVVGGLFKAAGFTYGPLLGMYAFGLSNHRKVEDKVVPIIAVLAVVISYLLNQSFSIGFEILIYNGAIMFLGMYACSKKAYVKV